MHESIWRAGATRPDRPPLDRDMSADAVVIGGGMAGVVTALLLHRAGLKIVLLERGRCGDGESQRTTAHLAYVTDARLSRLVRDFGHDHARLTWDAGRAGIDLIESHCREDGVDCEFRRTPGFLHSPWKGDDDSKALRDDANLARQLGFPAQFLDKVPVVGRNGVRFADQAKFHPMRYLKGVLSLLPEEGVVFEHSEVTEILDDPVRVVANGRTIHCDHAILTTFVPLQGIAGLLAATYLQSKLASYSSYAIAAKAPREAGAEALYWDTSDPYYYLRIDGCGDEERLIFGGCDHKTGQQPADFDPFKELEERLQTAIPEAQPTARWSGQVVDSMDGLPFIGETEKGQYIATGFGGNGMTFGALAGLILRDAILGADNPWRELFDANRTKPLAGGWNYLAENIDYPYYLVSDRLTAAAAIDESRLKPGHGMLLKSDGERVAAYRTPSGSLIRMSPVCPHMGCLVRWNELESTWDCPCHGSRFQATGELLTGPAETPLKRLE
ncbi:MAG TPA: FAD-dependent oxidoreductase [Planctomycetia bacterium]|nr:FAD-dependent oxidoreductase [Planctomycetia bacterium]